MNKDLRKRFKRIKGMNPKKDYIDDIRERWSNFEVYQIIRYYENKLKRSKE